MQRANTDRGAGSRPGGRAGLGLVAAMACALAAALWGGAARAESEELRRVRDLLRLWEVKAAHRELAKILQSDPANAEAHYEMGRILLSYDPPLYEESIKHLSYAVEREGKRSHFHLWLARAWGMKLENSNVVAAALGPVWQVKDHFEKAVALDSANQAARVDLFQYYLFAPGIVGGGRDKALAQLRALSELSSDSVLFHTAQAVLALKDGDYTTAVIEFERVAQLEPDNAGQVYFQLGFIHLAEGKYKEAQRYLTKAFKADTPIERPHQVLAPGYVRNAFYEKAKFEIENNVKVAVDSASLSREDRLSRRQDVRDPEYGRALKMLGAIYDKHGHPKLALAYYQRAKSLGSQE